MGADIRYHRFAAQEGELIPVKVLDSRGKSILVEPADKDPHGLPGWLLASAFVDRARADELVNNYKRWQEYLNLTGSAGEV